MTKVKEVIIAGSNSPHKASSHGYKGVNQGALTESQFNVTEATMLIHEATEARSVRGVHHSFELPLGRGYTSCQVELSLNDPDELGIVMD